MTSPLFEPIRLRGLTLENRVMVSPMCQYSAVDGSMTDWHFAHLGMLAPSAIPMGEGELVPRALTRAEIQDLVAKFADSTRRAERLGFDAIELHSAHGYLMHEFLSPLSNWRDDEYGGPLANRMRFPLEVFAAVRAAWPEGKPLGVRISCTDWIEGGWDLEQSLVFARELKRLGCDWIDCSSGGAVENPNL